MLGILPYVHILDQLQYIASQFATCKNCNYDISITMLTQLQYIMDFVQVLYHNEKARARQNWRLSHPISHVWYGQTLTIIAKWRFCLSNICMQIIYIEVPLHPKLNPFLLAVLDKLTGPYQLKYVDFYILQIILY